MKGADDLADAYNHALDLEKTGDIDAAIDAYERVLAMDPADPGGVSVRMAALGRGPVPTKAPESYVALLFDQHADTFEDILVDQLHYGVPTLARARLDALRLGPFARMLDLGCGTGLTAEAMRDRAEEIIGLDLSERMIDVCEEKDVFEGLYVGEAEAFLADNEETKFDLITACDVLPYLGDLDPLFSGAAANLLLGGIFAFSSETLSTGNSAGATYAVGRDQRFAHAEFYVRDRLGATGFTVLACDAINVRTQDGAPTPGHLVVARLTS